MSVISCYNCGRSRHIAKECRQRSNNELLGPKGHSDFGRQGTSLVNREPVVPRRLDYADQGSRANF